MCMGIIPCPEALLGLEAICVTLPGVRGETFHFSCVIRKKKAKHWLVLAALQDAKYVCRGAASCSSNVI